MPVAAAGLLIACAGVLLRSTQETHTVSQVEGIIRDIALAGRMPDAPRNAGMLGIWRINAETFDPRTRCLRNFRMRSGHMVVAARTAVIVVDPVSDSFSFELKDVVYTRVSDEDKTASHIHEFEAYVLGPIAYEHDIVPDGAGSFGGRSLPPPLGPASARAGNE